jgi:hypothetical protein
METAASLIKSALQEILVQASESELGAAEFQDGVKYLNRMMDRFASQGINLGYTAVSNLGDAITVPGGAIDGMVSNLAKRLFPQFSSPGTAIDPILVQEASDGLEAMRTLGISVSSSSLAGSPIGSGSEDDFNNWHFYPGEDEGILTEQEGFIATESETTT